MLSAKAAEGTGVKQDIAAFELRINELKVLRDTFSTEQKAFGALTAQVEQMEAAINQWNETGLPRLVNLEGVITREAFSVEEREKVRLLEETIKAGGYDANAHEAARKAELAARDSETEFHSLEKARAAVDGLRRELKTLEEGRTAAEEEIKSQTLVMADLRKKLSLQKESLPDLPALQVELDRQKEEENQFRQETGAAKQMVAVLEMQRKRKAELGAQIEDMNRLITRLKLLEIAFGKDGIPALLIEQALPEIESQANEILDRLSDGRMSLSFETEKEYKDKKRDDKKPTLDILISDSSGRREYELFSGGEAFRINFAIRLALSRVLAGRAGARLRTLVIDEGFGSQDAEGRQRLIEAINLVSRDFAKILVITHLDELKDAFPSRIEVTKTENGSRVEVIP
jgi:exonuclease SbcC